MTRVGLHVGDCLDVLRALPDNSVDSIVTDPPYGLTQGKKGGTGPASVNLNSPQGRARITVGFMGHAWDADVPSVEIWRECLRVLKPGGHLLAFAGTRTQHRMAVRIEDAGFEIRDMIAWVYGSGMPKSLDISKALDKKAGAEREVLSEGKPVKRMIPGADQDRTGSWIKDNGREFIPTLTAPATPEAQQWVGWGTALKPSLEPVTVARKPLTGTVAANVQQWGTGGLNIDGCRVEPTGESRPRVDEASQETRYSERGSTNFAAQPGVRGGSPDGRWPANLIHDGSDEVLALFPESKGQQAAVTGNEPSGKTAGVYGKFAVNSPAAPRGDSGSAARFFYCAKASRRDRNEGVGGSDAPAVRENATMRDREDADWQARNGNHHPTVKPTDLMRYLCRLVTPPGGVVLDPFMGSGSTGKAAVLEGFGFIGIDLSEEYVQIARQRVAHAQTTVRAQQPVLLGGD